MSELTFEQLRTANVERVASFGHGNLNEGWNVQEWGCAVAGEVGELCNLLKKVNRNLPSDPTLPQARQEIADECADVAIYLDLIAAKCGIDLGAAIRAKFNRTSERFGYAARIP